jgi:hypothetical protein
LIDHPLDNNKKLQYASLEGPEHGVFLRGKTNENINYIFDILVYFNLG